MTSHIYKAVYEIMVCQQIFDYRRLWRYHEECLFLGNRKLRMSAKMIMSTAEKLYTQGYISYPREVD